MFPKTIIETIIFRYAVYSNTYKYKYSVPCNEFYDNICFNKSSGIVCARSHYSFKLIDYNTGLNHDNSLIDTKLFNSCFIHEHDHGFVIAKPIHFDNNVLSVQMSDNILTFFLQNKQYKYIRNNHRLFCYDNALYVYNDSVYVIDICDTMYMITEYDLDKLTINNASEYNSCKYINLQISVHDDVIYVYDNVNIYTHDINTFDRLNQYSCNRDYPYARLHKNKLYTLEQNVVNIYNVITFECICSFEVDINSKFHGIISLCDDILMISDNIRIIFYDIK
jgi:hypothetical protein